MKRFAFGANWLAYSSSLTEEQLEEASTSLSKMLSTDSLDKLSFLDAGCGSGVFSLAALRLGARVVSFDYDQDSVNCTEQLKIQHDAANTNWNVLQGSVLDQHFLASLGTFDIVYSWGVLHHTGDMWQACSNIAKSVKPGGKLFIALYNDQGARSVFWTAVKRTYCSNVFGQALIKTLFVPIFYFGTIASCLIKGKSPKKYFASYRERRGMSPYYDWIDWLGGYPFEYASFDEVQDFFEREGFVLKASTKTRGLGCNQFVFLRP